jgi:hypothetical protein
MEHLANRTVRLLDAPEMLRRLNAVFYPAEYEFTSEEIDVMLLEFCLNCPDPVGAMDVVLDAECDTTSESVLARALGLEPRSPASYSEDQLSLDHPLRHWRVQLRAL